MWVHEFCNWPFQDSCGFGSPQLNGLFLSLLSPSRGLKLAEIAGHNEPTTFYWFTVIINHIYPNQLLSFAFLYAVDTFLWCRYIYNSKSYPKWVHTSLQSNKLLLCDQPQVLIKLDKAIGSVICATILISLSERNAIDVKLKPVSKIKMLPICLSITTRESFIAAMRNCVQADKLIPRLARDKWWPRRDQRKKMSLLRKIKNNCPVYPRSSKNTTPEEPLWANPDPRAAFGAYLLGTFKTCLGLPAVASTSRPRKRAYRTTTSSVC